jgi:hypothetical protein
MHVPDAVAFTLYCRLMDDPGAGGAGLRAMYAPGLDPLKRELAAFECLLGARLPALAAHLRAAGLAPVLYARWGCEAGRGGLYVGLELLHWCLQKQNAHTPNPPFPFPSCPPAPGS